MRILQLSPRIPYPLTEGGNIGIFNITRQLSWRGGKVEFVAVTDRPDDDSTQALRELCEDVLTLHVAKKYGLKLAVENLFSPVPVNVAKYHSKPVLDKILNFVEGKRFDLVHVDHLSMAYYGLAVGRRLHVPVVLREHNFEMKIMERFAETSSNPFQKAYARMQVAKFRKYEPTVCAQVDKCVMITEDDRRRLLSLRGDIDTTVIPAGVDTDFFKPENSPGEENAVAYIGSLDWLPNTEGLKWFIRRVLPEVMKARPGVKFYIYGKNPSHDLFKLHNGRNVIVQGFVSDVREVFRRARVMVVPLRAGSGMRIKILEAMAAGKSIVTTSIGSEGIKCEDGRNIMIADHARLFAGKITELLENAQLRESIGKEASLLAAGEYSWDKIGGMFWDTYMEIFGRYQDGGHQV